MAARRRIPRSRDPRALPRWQRWSYRVAFTLFVFCVVVLGGGLSIWITGEGEYTLPEAIYFSLITVSTVGYGELPHLAEHDWARLVSAITIVSGLITLALFQSTLTAFFVEGTLGAAMRKLRMNKKVASLRGHYIVAGCGRVGRYVVEELHRSGQKFVVIEHNESHVHELSSELGQEVLRIDGDATDDRILELAGIRKAAGLVCALTDDPDNLFVTLSARTLCPDLPIVSKVVGAHNEQKIRRAGATRTVSPQMIGGVRLAAELVRPTVTRFMDSLRLDRGMLFEEILISPTSEVAGKSLLEARLRERTNLLIVGFHLSDDTYVYNPGRDEVLRAGNRVIVMGPTAEVKALERVLGA